MLQQIIFLVNMDIASCTTKIPAVKRLDISICDVLISRNKREGGCKGREGATR